MYTFDCRVSLNQASALRDIPGVRFGPSRRGRVLLAPVNVAWRIEAILRQSKIPYRVTAPPGVPSPGSRAPGVAVPPPTEVHPWLWSTDPPTATEPLRLLPFQREAIRFGLEHDGCMHLWAPCGAGKTITAIALALHYPGPLLIVTRAGARETQRRELVRCTSCQPMVLGPKAAGPDDLAAYTAAAKASGLRPVVIVGWSGLSDYEEALTGLLRDGGTAAGGTIIFDEAHMAKNYRRMRWHVAPDGGLASEDLDSRSAVAARLAKLAAHRITTTATPITDRLPDLWGQLTLVEPDAWGMTASKFLFRYCAAQPGKYGGLETKGMSNVAELQKRLTFTVHKVDPAVVLRELPPKRRRVDFVPADDLVTAYKWDLAREAKAAAKEAATASPATREAARGRLLSIRLMEAASQKRRAVVETVKERLSDAPEGRGKIIVFTGRRRDAEELARQLEGPCDSAAAELWMAHGGHSIEERQEIQDAYMAAPGPAVLVGTMDAWGQSLNLHDTDLLVVAMLPWTPGMLDQIEGRVHRLGQKRPVEILYMIAEGTVDERIASIILEKLPAVEQVVGATPLDGLSAALMGIADRDDVLATILDAFTKEEA